MGIRIFALSILLSTLILVPLHTTLGQVQNLSENHEVTAKIRAEDREFFKDFDVYLASTRENPVALLLDPKDGVTIASRLWGEPLKEEDIFYAIARLEERYRHHAGARGLFEPRALNIVSGTGTVVGYVYTSQGRIFMDRKKDGRVTVFVPTYYHPREREKPDRNGGK